MLRNFQILTKAIWNCNYNLINPHVLFFNTWELIPAFEGYSQQDAHEFLSSFIHYLRDLLAYEKPVESEVNNNQIPFDARDFTDKLVTKLRGRNQLRVTRLKYNFPDFFYNPNV